MINLTKHTETNVNPFVMFLKEGKSFNPEDTTFDSDRINFKFKSEEELYDLITEIDSSNSIAEAKK